MGFLFICLGVRCGSADEMWLCYVVPDIRASWRLGLWARPVGRTSLLLLCLAGCVSNYVGGTKEKARLMRDRARQFHPYEGYPLATVTYPIRVMKALGVRNVISASFFLL